MHEKTVDIAEFQANPAVFIGDIKSGKLDNLVLTDHAKPIIKVARCENDVKRKLTFDDLHGCMKGSITIAEGVDLTDGTGEIWDAAQ